MPKLYRPSIPVEVKCRVALRQLGEMWPDVVIADNRFSPRDHRRRSLGALLDRKLLLLAETLGCERADLRLDHDPPLGSRMRRTLLDGTTRYSPDANDPEHLFYRPHGPQFAGSHLIKTNVRGDHGQHPDRVLIKRERRRGKKVPCARCHANYRIEGRRLCGRCLKVARRHAAKKKAEKLRRARAAFRMAAAVAQMPKRGLRSFLGQLDKYQKLVAASVSGAKFRPAKRKWPKRKMGGNR